MISTNYNNANNLMAKALERLSTGKQLNKVADNAAGMAIVTKMTAQLKGLEQADRNIENAGSMMRTAEGGMSAISDMLLRMRELSVQAADGSMTANDRTALQSEYQTLKSEIGRTAETTEFNQKPLINGPAYPLNVQAGPNAGQQLTVNPVNATPNALGITSSGIATQDEAQSAISVIDTAIANLSKSRANIGSSENMLEGARDNLSSAAINTANSISKITDTNFASEATSLAQSKLRLQAAIYANTKENQEKGRLLKLIT